MPPENPPPDRISNEPRFAAVSRRAFLRRSSTAGLSVAALALLAACGEPSLPDLAPASTADGAAEEASASSTADATAEPAGTDSADGLALPDGSALQIDFTYEASGGRIHSPYIAVWVEDAAGELVQAISLWFKADESKYLRDLTRWNALDDPTALSTGATRNPGTFAVSWDGVDLDGRAVPAGDYFICIESSREDGPYQIIREQVTLSPGLSPTALTPDGELVAASVSVVT